MNRQISLDCEQMPKTEPSIRSVAKERMIILFNSTILQEDCHFVEEFVNLERRSNSDFPNVEQRFLELEDERKNLARSVEGDYGQSRFVADGDLVVKYSCCLSRGASYGLSQRQWCSERIVRVILDRSKNYGVPLIECKCILLRESIQKNVENNLFVVLRDGIASVRLSDGDVVKWLQPS